MQYPLPPFKQENIHVIIHDYVVLGRILHLFCCPVVYLPLLRFLNTITTVTQILRITTATTTPLVMAAVDSIGPLLVAM